MAPNRQPAGVRTAVPATRRPLVRCRVDRSDVVAAVGELAGRGFVDRTPDPGHGRRNRVTLTEEGLRRLRHMDEVLDRVQDDLLGPLSAEDRQTLTRLLGRVLTHHEPH
ncbi:MarR family winged helix-turn-helix transcriptional regulator [Streptomyces verrucosisporus]|uniref:MarR family winged helix-turn-helix transcriptional regulator n=1 Tax=Streptomyces verrucosisporus TaxID=1695161 RepID=UPI001F122A17|nr:hypothetical protein [Streptomyces verrucosisporus]